MTKAKHTPGPWVWVRPKYWPNYETNEGYLGGIYPEASNDPVCGFGDNTAYYPSEGEVPTEADAHLIAAAPDLLEALEAMLSHTNGWDETQLRKRWGEQFVAEILTARAVIAKAKGE